MKTLLTATFLGLSLAATPVLAPSAMAKEKMPERPTAEIVQQADVSVGLNGLVCDFCARALNKVFRKRDEVAYTHVDLNTKILSVIFHAGQTLDDVQLEKLVAKAGYDMTSVERASK